MSRGAAAASRCGGVEETLARTGCLGWEKAGGERRLDGIFLFFLCSELREEDVDVIELTRQRRREGGREGGREGESVGAETGLINEWMRAALWCPACLCRTVGTIWSSDVQSIRQVCLVSGKLFSFSLLLPRPRVLSPLPSFFFHQPITFPRDRPLDKKTHTHTQTNTQTHTRALPMHPIR